MKSSPLFAFAALGLARAMAAEPAVKDSRYPFRTDFANAERPWYQPEAGEFPPHHSDRRISGELIAADYIHRSGQFRTAQGEVMDFTLQPYGWVSYLNAEADLRDVPLGTSFLFFLHQDAQGNFTRLATMQEQFTMDASHSFTYRLDAVRAEEGKLLVTKQSLKKKQPDLGQKELIVKSTTRLWRGDQRITLADLAAGDELLFNLTGKTADDPGWCTDLYVGTATHQLATEQQRRRHSEFEKSRGVPGWLDHTENNEITLTLFSGDAPSFRQAYADLFAEGKEVSVAVANDELRTWNPPVDRERGTITKVERNPQDGYGNSGLRLTVKVTNMLEGFRRGRVVRLFGSGWKVGDQPYGESLMGYGFGKMLCADLLENPAKEYPRQFPFRTDFGNEGLAWLRLAGQSADELPKFAEHIVYGELVKTDATTGTGQFKAERTGELVEFTLLPKAAVQAMNARATLAELTQGTRYRFAMFQDEQGHFTRASSVQDDYSYSAANATSWRVENVQMGRDRFEAARQLAKVKDYNGDLQRPPDLGHAEMRITPATKFWKGSREVEFCELAPGDEILANFSAELPGAPRHCTEVWIGAETHQAIADARKPQKGAKK